MLELNTFMMPWQYWLSRSKHNSDFEVATNALEKLLWKLNNMEFFDSLIFYSLIIILKFEQNHFLHADEQDYG